MFTTQPQQKPQPVTRLGVDLKPAPLSTAPANRTERLKALAARFPELPISNKPVKRD